MGYPHATREFVYFLPLTGQRFGSVYSIGTRSNSPVPMFKFLKDFLFEENEVPTGTTAELGVLGTPVDLEGTKNEEPAAGDGKAETPFAPAAEPSVKPLDLTAPASAPYDGGASLDFVVNSSDTPSAPQEPLAGEVINLDEPVNTTAENPPPVMDISAPLPDPETTKNPEVPKTEALQELHPVTAEANESTEPTAEAIRASLEAAIAQDEQEIAKNKSAIAAQEAKNAALESEIAAKRAQLQELEKVEAEQKLIAENERKIAAERQQVAAKLQELSNSTHAKNAPPVNNKFESHDRLAA